MQQIAFILIGWTLHIRCNKFAFTLFGWTLHIRCNKSHSSSLDELYIIDETNCTHVIFGLSHMHTSAGRVSFLIPARSGFHKINYRRLGFSLFEFSKKKLIHQVRVSISLGGSQPTDYFVFFKLRKKSKSQQIIYFIIFIKNSKNQN